MDILLSLCLLVLAIGWLVMWARVPSLISEISKDLRALQTEMLLMREEQNRKVQNQDEKQAPLSSSKVMDDFELWEEQERLRLEEQEQGRPAGE